jgi:hypothetical protein
MAFQAKLVDPDGKPKAIVATHDRVASGKEFALFQQMLAIMAIGCVPDEQCRFDGAGHMMSRLLTPFEIVQRAEELVLEAMRVASNNDWIVESAHIDLIYENHDENKQQAGFSSVSRLADNFDDEIPF